MSSRENPNAVWVRSLVPKEKNSATSAISPATSAAQRQLDHRPPQHLELLAGVGEGLGGDRLQLLAELGRSSSRVTASGIMISTIGLPRRP